MLGVMLKVQCLVAIAGRNDRRSQHQLAKWPRVPGGFAGIEREKNFEVLKDLCQTMRFGSLCALGALTPDPVRSALEYFPEDFAVRA